MIRETAGSEHQREATSEARPPSSPACSGLPASESDLPDDLHSSPVVNRNRCNKTVAIFAEAVIGPEPGKAHQPARRFIPALQASFAIGALEGRTIGFVEVAQLHHQRLRASALAHFKPRTVSSQASMSVASSRACRGPCGAITPISVKCPRSPLRSCRALREPTSPCVLLTHQRRLVLERALRRQTASKAASPPRRSPPHRGVVLLPGEYRASHKPEALLRKPRGRAPSARAPSDAPDPEALKPHQATWQRSEKLQQLVPPDRFGDHDAPRSINAMDLLGQIEPYGGDR